MPSRRPSKTASGRGRFTRRGAFQAGGAGALALGMAACGSDDFSPIQSHDEDAPNTLLIITDSTRADYIGAYNDRSIAKTPNIDALAKESLTFDLAVPESMPTGPCRRAIMRGKRGFPYRDWVATEGLPLEPGWTPIADDEPIFTETMGEAGVTTGYVTDNPFLIGPRFANFRRTLDYARPQYSQGAYREFNKPFERPATRAETEKYILPALSNSLEVSRLRSYVGWNSIFRRGERGYANARVARKAIDVLDEMKDQRPFFLGVDMFDPHEPFDPAPIYMKNYPKPPVGNIERIGVEPIQPWETPADELKNLDIDQGTLDRIRQLYAAELTSCDAWIGRILNKLDDLGLSDKTAVYYMSDHGVTLGEHGILGKSRSRIYYHIYHVPAMIRHPEKKLAGKRSDYFASTHDIAPTLLSFMGIRTPGQMDGEDLTVLFEGGEPPERRYFTSCYAEYTLIGDQDWLLICDTTGREKRLYNRKDDPGELTDVAGANGEVVDRMYAALIDEAGGSLPQIGSDGVLGG